MSPQQQHPQRRTAVRVSAAKKAVAAAVVSASTASFPGLQQAVAPLVPVAVAVAVVTVGAVALLVSLGACIRPNRNLCAGL